MPLMPHSANSHFKCWSKNNFKTFYCSASSYYLSNQNFFIRILFLLIILKWFLFKMTSPKPQIKVWHCVVKITMRRIDYFFIHFQWRRKQSNIGCAIHKVRPKYWVRKIYILLTPGPSIGCANAHQAPPPLIINEWKYS